MGNRVSKVIARLDLRKYHYSVTIAGTSMHIPQLSAASLPSISIASAMRLSP